MSIEGQPQAPALVSARTDGLPEREKFSYWNDVICRTVVDLECRPVAQPRFEASIVGFDAPGLGVYHIHTQPHLVYREAAEISRLDNDALIINFVTAGSLYSEQDGRAVVLKPGDGAISDAARPYFLRFDDPLGCVSVKVSKSELRHRVAGIERITAQSLAKGSTLNPMVFGYMGGLLQHVPTMEGEAALRATEIFKELLSASLSEMLRGSPVPMSEYRAVSLLRVKAFVDRHLCNPALNPTFVTQGLKLSARYINKLFEAEKSSLGRHIWQRRLESCAAKLRDAGFVHVSVSAVALEHGFNDLSHFSRSFRSKYGLSPREFRARPMSMRASASMAAPTTSNN
jgi:AraC family transcriptional regulator, positive regulator of tynA and feaB